MLDVVGAGDVAARIGVLDRAVVAIDFRREHNAAAFACRLHGPAARIARGCDGAHSGAVIRAIAGDDFVFAGDHARDLEGRFIGLGAAGGKEEFINALGENFKQFLAEPRARRGGIAWGYVGKLAGLLGNRFHHAWILVTEVDAHQLRREIEIAAACAIGKPAAFGVGNIHWLPTLLEAPGAVVRLPRNG